MPDNKLNFEQMLDELADEYPQLKAQAVDLKEEVMDLMPMDEEEPVMEPELNLELDMDEDEEEELELEL